MSKKVSFSEHGAADRVDKLQEGNSLKFRYDRVLNAVKKTNVSQKDFAAKIGITISGFRNICEGRNEVRILKFLKICELLKVSPMCFIDDPNGILGEGSSAALVGSQIEDALAMRVIRLQDQLDKNREATLRLEEEIRDRDIRDRDMRIQLLEWQLNAKDEELSKAKVCLAAADNKTTYLTSKP